MPDTDACFYAAIHWGVAYLQKRGELSTRYAQEMSGLPKGLLVHTKLTEYGIAYRGDPQGNGVAVVVRSQES